MVRFGCLVCKVKFNNSADVDLNGNVISKEIPVLTVCGHYFHLECLRNSFSADRERVKYSNDVPLSSEEIKSAYIQRCPFESCRKNLDDTKLTKIKVRDDAPDDSQEVIIKLEEQIKQLQEELRKCKLFQVGHLVSYKNPQTGKAVCGSVSKLLVHNSRQNQNESFSNEAINSSTCNHDSIKSNRLSGGSGSFVTVPADLVCSVPVDSSPVPVVTKKEKDKKVKKASVKKDMSGLNAEFEKLQPKWAAGDRIYLTKEKEFASIKWIGNRQYKFMVVIEYDRPVGDNNFASDDLPFLIERGYGRQLSIEELHATAQKANSISPRTLLNSFVRWKTIRNRRPQNPMFFVERSHSTS